MHAAGYLAQAAQASFGPGTAETSAWFATARATLRRGDADATLALLATLPESPARETARHYLEQRHAMLAYARCDAEGWPVGSGAVESANKQVVEARLKGAGMHWSREHANAILALTALEASNRWETCWPRLVHGLRQLQHDRAAARRVARAPEEPTPMGSSAVPASRPSSPTPREKTIVNGKPTADHPWNSHRPRLSDASS